MSIQNKPDYKVFASDAKSGEIELFPDILRGWGVTIDRTGEIPPMEWFNAIGKRVDEWLLYLTQRGVPEWDTSIDYPKSSMVMFGDNFYVSKKETKGESPSVSAVSWSRLSDFIGVPQVVQSTGASTTQVMSQDAVTKLANGKQPSGDYATNTALTNGLNRKLDKTGGVLNGGLTAEGGVIAQGVIESYKSVAAVVPGGVGAMLDSTGGLPVIKSRESSVLGWKKHSLQNKDGTLAHISDLEKMFPIGASILWNTSAPIPGNFWTNEGRSFSASEYPELANVYPNLKLPDDRGYAIRIADNGRGIDQGRVIGTYQEDAMRDITGEVGNVQARGEGVTQSGALYYTGTGEKGNSSLGADSVIKIRFAASRQVPTADEFRMKNVAKILITRVK